MRPDPITSGRSTRSTIPEVPIKDARDPRANGGRLRRITRTELPICGWTRSTERRARTPLRPANQRARSALTLR